MPVVLSQIHGTENRSLAYVLGHDGQGKRISGFQAHLCVDTPVNQYQDAMGKTP